MDRLKLYSSLQLNLLTYLSLPECNKFISLKCYIKSCHTVKRRRQYLTFKELIWPYIHTPPSRRVWRIRRLVHPLLPPIGHIWDVMLVWRKGMLIKLSLCYSTVYYYNGAQRYEQFLQVGRLYRALISLSLAFCLPSASCLLSSWCYIHSIFKRLTLR